jgi:hypothetical protein
VGENKIPRVQVAGAGRRLGYGGRSLSELTDDERGALWALLSEELEVRF